MQYANVTSSPDCLLFSIISPRSFSNNNIRLDHSVAGNNSDTAACGARDDDEIGSPKAAAAATCPHYQRRGAHRFIHASSTEAAAAAVHEGLPDPSADRPALRLVDGRGYVSRGARTHTHAARVHTRARTHTSDHEHTHTRDHEHTHGHANANTHAHANTNTHAQRAHVVSSRVGSCRVFGVRAESVCRFGPPSQSAVLFHSPLNADRRRIRRKSL